MPIQVFKCNNRSCSVLDNTFERILSVKDDVDIQLCEICSSVLEWIPSNVCMRPDIYWSGVVTDTGYVTSQSRYEKEKKARGIEAISANDLPAFKRQCKQRAADKVTKQQQELSNFISEEMRSVTVEPDGYTIQQRNDYVKAREEK